jgi:hypothetical protein
LDRHTVTGNRSKKTLATHSPAAAAAADKAAARAGEIKFQRGRPKRPFDWDSVTPEQREAAMADYKKRKAKT